MTSNNQDGQDDRDNRNQNNGNNNDNQNNDGQQSPPKITPKAAEQMIQAMQQKENQTQDKVNREKAKALRANQRREKLVNMDRYRIGILRVIASLLFTLFATLSFAQNFSVDAPNVVEKDEIFRIVYTCDAEVDEFIAPSLTGLELLAGPMPSRMSSTNIVNGSQNRYPGDKLYHNGKSHPDRSGYCLSGKCKDRRQAIFGKGPEHRGGPRGIPPRLKNNGRSSAAESNLGSEGRSHRKIFF